MLTSLIRFVDITVPYFISLSPPKKKTLVPFYNDPGHMSEEEGRMREAARIFHSLGMRS
jgi:hypothetical protein